MNTDCPISIWIRIAMPWTATFGGFSRKKYKSVLQNENPFSIYPLIGFTGSALWHRLIRYSGLRFLMPHSVMIAPLTADLTLTATDLNNITTVTIIPAL